METTNNNETFSYTYSAKQQEEVKRIAQKYMPQEGNKLEQLRRLDKSATTSGTMAAIAVGTISTLLLGVGMCCTMVWKNFFVIGIIIGLIGIIGVALAYPLYNKLTSKRREKLAPEIRKLSEELMGQQ